MSLVVEKKRERSNDDDCCCLDYNAVCEIISFIQGPRYYRDGKRLSVVRLISKQFNDAAHEFLPWAPQGYVIHCPRYTLLHLPSKIGMKPLHMLVGEVYHTTIEELARYLTKHAPRLIAHHVSVEFTMTVLTFRRIQRSLFQGWTKVNLEVDAFIAKNLQIELKKVKVFDFLRQFSQDYCVEPVLSGSMVLAQILRDYKKEAWPQHLKSNDIDVFIVGAKCTLVSQCVEILQKCGWSETSSLSKFDEDYYDNKGFCRATFVRTVIEEGTEELPTKLDLIQTNHTNALQLVNSFDLNCCKVWYEPFSVWNRGEIKALHLDETLRGITGASGAYSVKNDERKKKYQARGFTIYDIAH